MPAALAKVVVFDIGKVLIDWDPRHLYRTMFADECEMQAFLRDVCARDWILELDRGKPFVEAVTERIALFPHYEAEIRAFDERWHETNRGVIEGAMTILKRLQSARVPNYAITNFSAEKFAECRARFSFLEHFDGIVVSAHERMVKPDPAIFQVLFERYALEAETCLFIDDASANITAARELGMTALLFTGAAALAGDLRKLGFAV